MPIALYKKNQTTLEMICKWLDPELAEIFVNFAFEEVLGHGNLDVRTRLMVLLASMIACQALREYRAMLGTALTVGVTPVQVKEIVYQEVPYLGMAKVYDFIDATNEVLLEQGVELPLPGQSTTSSENRAERGLAVLKQIIGLDALDERRALHTKICSTFSATLWIAASATTTLAQASMCQLASCSPSACWSRSADANWR